MTSPSTDKSVSSKNALNVRVGCRRGFTIPLGPYESERVEFSAELDLPSDKTLTDGLSELDACLQDLQAEARKKYEQQKPQVPAQPSTSSPASPSSTRTAPTENRATASLSLDEAEIAKATWKPQAKSGDWTFAHEVP